MAMQHKWQGLICEYLHFLVDNVCLVEKVGDSHIGFIYCLMENDPRLLTFEDFFHTPYCKVVWDQDDDNVDNPEEAEESDSNKAAAGAGNGSKSDKAGNESDVTVKVGNKPMLEAKGKHKASESVRVAKGHRNGTKHMKVTTGKPTAEVEVKAKPVAKAAAAKSLAKSKTPPKSPLKKK